MKILPDSVHLDSKPSGTGLLSHRNHQFDLLRIIFATLVLLSHAPELEDHNRSRELFTRLTRSPVSFGDLAVDGFFLLSGYLILQSWMRGPRLLSYLEKRVLRIVPGYFVAVFLSVTLVGVFAPAEPHFFEQLRWMFAESILFLSDPATPRVFPHNLVQSVNGSMWTIAYEFRCYLLAAVLGWVVLRRGRWVWLACTLILLILLFSPALRDHLQWTRLLAVLGKAHEDLRLAPIFFIGGTFYLFRDRILFRPVFALLAAVLLVLTDLFAAVHLEFALVLLGGYLLFYFGHRPLSGLAWMRHVPDISYGVYLYGWPVESAWIWLHHGSPWITFGIAVAICYPLGWLSWHFVERPMLKLKRPHTAPLPVP